MKFVWVVHFVEKSDVIVAASAEKAYEICDHYIRNMVTPEGLRKAYLIELEADYKENPEWFFCEDVCGAERVEVVGAGANPSTTTIE